MTTNFKLQGDPCPAQRQLHCWPIIGAERGYYLLHKVGRKEKPVNSEADLRLAPAKVYAKQKS